MRGADALIRALERAGVDTVFGIPGGACLPIYDALHDSPIRHVLMRHEAAAGHAAEGYARATGRIGVAIGTSGPGATNLVTAIADAQMDSTPTLFITGQVKTTLRGTNAFQEADVIGITQPLVKHSISIERADDVAQAVVDAIRIARQRPARAGADRPAGRHRQRARARRRRTSRTCPATGRASGPNGRQVRRAAEALAAARRPVLYAGGGVTNADAADELRELAALTGAPGDDDADGARRVPRLRPAVARDARHARHAGRQLGDGRGRPDRRHRRPLRRPRDRRAGRVRAAARRSCTSTSTRPRSARSSPAHVPVVGDAQARAGGADPRATRKLDADAARLAEWWRRIRGWQAAHPLRAPEPPTPAASRPSRRSTRSRPCWATRS